MKYAGRLLRRSIPPAAVALLVIAASPAVAAAVGRGSGHHKHRPKPPPPPPLVSATVDSGHPGLTIPKSFLGLSIEYPDVPSYTGTPDAPNDLFVRLLQQLGSYGNGPPTLRIGGNSQDQSWWNPSALGRPPGIFTDIRSDWVGDLNVTVSRARTPVILGLNLGLNDPSNAKAMAEGVIGGLPSGAVRQLEIGNEPDLYTTAKTFYVGKRLQRRAQHRASYGFDPYLQDLDNYVGVLSDLGIPLSAGGFAGRTWDPFTDQLLLHANGRLAAFETHAYPLNTCGAARHHPSERLIRRLLSNRQAVGRIARLAPVTQARGVPLQVSESNSTICGGVKGVSDTFATALWGTNALFGFFEAGATGVDLHTWIGAFYSPLEFARIDGGLVATVHPLFYGMLLFARATANRAQLLPVLGTERRGVKTWATRDSSGTVRVLVLNMSGSVDRRARVSVLGSVGTGRLERLLAPSLASKGGVTLGGQSYGLQTADAFLHGHGASAQLQPHGNSYTFALPAASAALLTVPPAATPRPPAP